MGIFFFLNDCTAVLKPLALLANANYSLFAMIETHASSKEELAIPLCLPDNWTWYPQTGKSVKTRDKRSSLYVIEEALEQLREIKGK